MIRVIRFFKIPEGIRIPYFGGLWYRLIRSIENRYIRKVKIEDFPLNDKTREKKVIVSLTSFPDRIEAVQYAIKSLMLQTYKPDKIILWLAEEQFSEHTIPDELIKLKEYGLEIRFCPDIKSHKKYYYVMQEYKNDLVITYDDDIIYEHNSIKKLIKYHIKYPNCIICNRGMHITFNNKKVDSVKKWKALSNEGVKKPSINIMASTGAGCLYPPNALSGIVFDLDLSQKYAQSADDIWMKFMSLLNNTKVVKTAKYNRSLSTIEKSQHVQLTFVNTFEGQNDVVMGNLIKLFPEGFKRLKDS